MIIQNWQWKHHYLFLKKWQQAVNRLTLNVIEEHTAMKALQNYRTVRHLLVVQQNSEKSEAELLVIMNEWQQVVNKLTLNVIEEHTAMKTLQNHRTVRHLLVIQQNSKKSEAELLAVTDKWL